LMKFLVDRKTHCTRAGSRKKKLTESAKVGLLDDEASHYIYQLSAGT
jgi:hypothetical protein